MKRVYILSFILLLGCAIATSTTNDVVFGHGFGGNRMHGRLYQDTFSGCNIHVFDFPDSPGRPEYAGRGFPNMRETSLGQDNEIDEFQQKFREVKERNRNGKMIVAGVSRGAITALNGNFEGADGIFVESPGNMRDIVKGQCRQSGVGWVPFLDAATHWCVVPWILQKHNPAGPHPIDSVANIPREMPIFISYTKEDGLIPPSSTVKIAEKLVQTGHNNVYLWGANKGEHGYIIHGPDRAVYEKVAKAFVRKVTGQRSHFMFGQRDPEGDRMLEDAKLTPESLDDLGRLRKELEWNECTQYPIRNLISFVCFAAAVGFAANKLLG